MGTWDVYKHVWNIGQQGMEGLPDKPGGWTFTLNWATHDTFLVLN